MNTSNAGTDVSFTHLCIIQVVYLDVLENIRVSLDLKYYRYTSEIFFFGYWLVNKACYGQIKR